MNKIPWFMVFCVLSGQHSIDVFLFKFKHVSPCYPWMDSPFQLNIRFYLYFWLLQEKEACRCSIKETVKSMLAFGWTIERTKEGEAFGLHTCKPRVSQSGQVCVLYIVLSLSLNSKHAYCNRSHSQLNFSCTGFLCSSCLLKELQHSAPNLWTWAVSRYPGTNV